jgi:DNA-binding GntR family transcriptional regulator
MARAKSISSKEAAASPPVQLQEHIRLCLENDIIDGRALPGERLDEQSVAQRFKVSRTPVREALLQLSSMGLVEFRSRHGAIVAQLTVKQIFAMWEFLVGLEGMCAEFAARRMTNEERQKLAQLHASSAKLVEANDSRAYDLLNKQIHESIYAGAKNKHLEQQVSEIRRRLRIYRRYPFERPGGMQRSFVGHEKVIKAILEGDEAKAGAEMRAHVTTGGMAFNDFIAEMPSRLFAEEMPLKAVSEG